LRGNFCEVLGTGHADRDWKAKLCPHTAPDRACNFGWWTEEMGATRDIGKGLVDGNSLDEGREIMSTLMTASPSRW